MALTYTHLIIMLVAIFSFLFGRHFGRIGLYEDIVKITAKMRDLESHHFVLDHQKLSRPFHWGTELLPGIRFYGFRCLGFSLGYTHELKQKRA